jgi:epsilon-lactone hydrolase
MSDAFDADLEDGDLASFVEPEEADRSWFAELVAQAQAQPRADPPPTASAMRERLRTEADGPNGRTMSTDVETVAVDIDGLETCWFRPKAEHRRAPVLYFHGGGYVCGSVYAARGLAAELARRFAAAVLAVDYRQGPEHPFPAAEDDAWASFRWLAAQALGPVTLVGDSAGGALAVITALRAAAKDRTAVRCAIGSSAWFDLGMTGPSWTANAGRDVITRDLGDFFRRNYLPDGAPQDRTPLRLEPAPPVLLQAGEAEMPLSDSVALARRARAAGPHLDLEIYRYMIHNFIKFPKAIGDLAIQRMVQWERTVAASATGSPSS